MSFSLSVKEEISQLNELDYDEYLAELASILHFLVEKTDDTLVLNTYSTCIARRFTFLTKKLYPKVIIKTTKEKKSKGTKISYILLKSQDIISEHGLNEDTLDTLEILTQKDECKQAFIRGAFLSIGTITDPNNGEYHLEFYHNNSNLLIFLQSVINYFDFSYKLSKRRKGFIVYTKNSTTISNTLLLIQAITQSYDFEDIRIKRDMSSSLNRVINCQVINEMRTIDISTSQIILLNKIIDTAFFASLDKQSQEIINLRIKYPELSYLALASKYSKIVDKKISKSFVFRKLHKVLQAISTN